VYVMVCTITRFTLQEQLLTTLFHEFLLLGMVIFAELADVFRVSLNHEGLVAVFFYYVCAYSSLQCMVMKEICVLTVTRSLQ
jgi:hypothetical protein